MNAQQALEISESNLPPVIDKKYQSIIEGIEMAAKRGKTDFYFGFRPPCKEVIQRLGNDGYRLYSIGDNFMCPRMYGASWAVKNSSKKWYQKIFN